MVYKIYDYTKSKTRKWTRITYYLDTRRVNAHTIAAANGKVVEGSFGFGWNLCLALVKPLMEAIDNKLV